MKHFKLFGKDDLNELISEQTTLYSVQQNGKSVATTPGEIELWTSDVDVNCSTTKVNQA